MAGYDTETKYGDQYGTKDGGTVTGSTGVTTYPSTVGRTWSPAGGGTWLSGGSGVLTLADAIAAGIDLNNPAAVAAFSSDVFKELYNSAGGVDIGAGLNGKYINPRTDQYDLFGTFSYNQAGQVKRDQNGVPIGNTPAAQADMRRRMSGGGSGGMQGRQSPFGGQPGGPRGGGGFGGGTGPAGRPYWGPRGGGENFTLPIDPPGGWPSGTGPTTGDRGPPADWIPPVNTSGRQTRLDRASPFAQRRAGRQGNNNRPTPQGPAEQFMPRIPDTRLENAKTQFRSQRSGYSGNRRYHPFSGEGA